MFSSLVCSFFFVSCVPLDKQCFNQHVITAMWVFRMRDTRFAMSTNDACLEPWLPGWDLRNSAFALAGTSWLAFCSVSFVKTEDTRARGGPSLLLPPPSSITDFTPCLPALPTYPPLLSPLLVVSWLIWTNNLLPPLAKVKYNSNPPWRTLAKIQTTFKWC